MLRTDRTVEDEDRVVVFVGEISAVGPPALRLTIGENQALLAPHAATL